MIPEFKCVCVCVCVPWNESTLSYEHVTVKERDRT